MILESHLFIYDSARHIILMSLAEFKKRFCRYDSSYNLSKVPSLAAFLVQKNVQEKAKSGLCPQPHTLSFAVVDKIDITDDIMQEMPKCLKNSTCKFTMSDREVYAKVELPTEHFQYTTCVEDGYSIDPGYYADNRDTALYMVSPCICNGIYAAIFDREFNVGSINILTASEITVSKDTWRYEASAEDSLSHHL